MAVRSIGVCQRRPNKDRVMTKDTYPKLINVQTYISDESGKFFWKLDNREPLAVEQGGH